MSVNINISARVYLEENVEEDREDARILEKDMLLLSFSEAEVLIIDNIEILVLSVVCTGSKRAVVMGD